MIQTSVSCGLGLLIFGLADFIPTSRFAWMSSSLIALALLADLFLLAALQLSPLGNPFEFNSPELRGECPSGSIEKTRMSPRPNHRSELRQRQQTSAP